MRTNRALLTSTLIPALLALAGVAAPALAEWRRIDSPNFVVVGDVNARTLRDVAVKFEGFRETLTRLLREQATSTPVPTVVVVFPSDRAFNPFKPTYKGKPVPISGLFVGGQDVNYIALVTDGAVDGLRIVFHEYAHLVVSNVVRSLPAWLNEGLAEYYSTYEVSDGGREAVLGRPLIHHLQRLNETSLLKLQDLLNVDHRSPLYNEAERRSVFYAQSWALTHRLLRGSPPRTSELARYLQRVSEGIEPMQAWQQAFGAANMQRELEDYVRRRTFQAVQYTFPDKLTKFDAPAVALPPADAEAFLAQFLVQQRRLDEASARLSEASKLDPGNVRVRAVKALLDIARGSSETAGTQLLAIADPSDWLVAYTAGVAIAELAEGRRDTSPELVRAVRKLFDIVRQQRAELPQALARLATVELHSSEGPSKETRAAIERARVMAPGREDYAFIHAQILVKLSDFAAARNVVGPMMSPHYSAEVRESARGLMGYIVQLENFEKERSRAQTAAAAEPAVPEQAAGAASTPRAGYVQPVFRDLQAGEQRLKGVLERIECSRAGAAVLHVRSADGQIRASAARLEAVDFISYRDDIAGSVGCGPLKPLLSVYLTWRAGKGDEKVAVAIEVLPK